MNRTPPLKVAGIALPQSAIARYGIAVIAVAAAVMLRLLSGSWFGTTAPYITLYPAVAVAALLGGAGPGIASSLLGLAASFWLLEPQSNLGGSLAIRTTFYLASSLFLSLLSEVFRRTASRSIETLRRLLEETTRRADAERERAEATRRAERDRDLLRTTLASIGDGVVVTDAEGKITFFNAAAETLTGWTQAEVLGKALSGIVEFRHDKSAAEAEFARVVLARRDGGSVPVEERSSPIRAGDGAPLGTVTVIRDVSLRRRAEEARRKSDERLSIALEAGRIGVWDWNVATDEIEWSNLVYDIHAMPRGIPPGSIEDFGRYIEPEDRDRVEESIRSALDGETVYSIQFRIVRPDGSRRWVDTRAHVVRDQSGKPIRMLGAVTDITDRKAGEQQLLDINAALVRANSELEEFAFVASHDIKEPLRMVNIYTQLIAAEYAIGNESLGEYAGYVAQGVQRMEDLIDGLLQFSRAGHVDEPASKADLNKALESAIEMVKPRIEMAKASIEAGPMPFVAGDTGQLTQVFQNLLSNALKYSRVDIAPSITIDAIREDNMWIISVSDNGIGFEPQYAERIFGLFKRLHKEEYPGTGVGLAICKRIVERYNGRMWAESRPGTGSTFRFALRHWED